jgi:hypothetical protein
LTNNDEQKLGTLKARLAASMKEHSTKCSLDSFFYNGGTVAVILATTVATVLPQGLGDWVWIPKVLTAFATFWVAIERVLNFGARWRFHLGMKNEYEVIIDMIDCYEFVPENKKEDQLQSIWQELKILRRKEGGLPISDNMLGQEKTADRPSGEKL